MFFFCFLFKSFSYFSFLFLKSFLFFRFYFKSSSYFSVFFFFLNYFDFSFPFLIFFLFPFHIRFYSLNCKMAALGFAQPQPFEWSQNATYSLICLRCHYHDHFKYVSNNRHAAIWIAISNALQMYEFIANPQQYRTKWYSLKYRYENLERLQSGQNLHNQPISNLMLYDRLFHQELSDEFWLRTGNYLFIDLFLNKF